MPSDTMMFFAMAVLGLTGTLIVRISSKSNFLTSHHREDLGERFIQQQDCLSNMTLN
jgi:hypothetical protein